MFACVAQCLLLSVSELLVQLRVPTVKRDLPTVDEEMTDARAGFEEVAVSDNEVGDLAGFD